jgi:hypothetical protein
MKSPRRALLVLLGLFAGGCGSGECPVLPCLAPIAVAVDVTAGGSAAGVPGAFVQVAGGSSISCDQAAGSTCLVPGGAGTYQLVIGAPGFQSVNRTVTVTSLNDPNATRGCGCAQVVTQHLDITLVPVA